MLQSISIPFFKYHALGNDYIVLRMSDLPVLADREIIRICDRHFGLGSDGILFDDDIREDGGFALRIFNPDGGEAEKSGNGLRIYSRYLWDMGRVRDVPFSIETKGGLVQAQILEDGAAVRVAMGTVSFDSSAIPMTGIAREVLQEQLLLEGEPPLTISAATIGNPHCIVLVEEPTAELARRLGPKIETHPAFPARTNVQFAKVVSREEIYIEIWERGAGYTFASGSSASATAATLFRLGLIDSQVEVRMPGGVLQVGIDSQMAVTMQGAVTRVAEGILFREMFS